MMGAEFEVVDGLGGVGGDISECSEQVADRAVAIIVDN